MFEREHLTVDEIKWRSNLADIETRARRAAIAARSEASLVRMHAELEN